MHVDEAIGRHVAQVNRCNQRGGRMLSVVDLIDAGSISPHLAAYALAAIGGGASFLVGARPGGAGKTTVMGALLNFVPAGVELVAADGPAAIAAGLEASAGPRCYVCHEIGSGPYYAYLWDDRLRAYFELPEAGHMLAANLHADTYQQARDQICGDNGVSKEALRRMNLMFFMAVRPSASGVRRRIEAVWESDSRGPHRRVFTAGQAVRPTMLATAEAIQRARRTIDSLTGSTRSIRQVRAAILADRDQPDAAHPAT